MDLAVAGKIERNGVIGNVFHHKSLGLQQIDGHFKASMVIGKDDRATFMQSLLEIDQQLAVIPQYIETLVHPLGIRESRRIDKNQIKLFITGRDPRQTIGLNKVITTSGKAIEFKIALGPIKISLGHIDCGDRFSTTGSSVNRGGAGISKQIQHRLAPGQLTHLATGNAVIQKQPGIQIIMNIDVKPQPIFIDFKRFITLVE